MFLPETYLLWAQEEHLHTQAYLWEKMTQYIRWLSHLDETFQMSEEYYSTPRVNTKLSKLGGDAALAVWSDRIFHIFIRHPELEFTDLDRRALALRRRQLLSPPR